MNIALRPTLAVLLLIVGLYLAYHGIDLGYDDPGDSCC